MTASVWDTPVNWQEVVASARRRYYERREQEARDRARQDNAVRVVRQAVRRLSTTGTHYVSEGLLSVVERLALYDLSDAQMNRLSIGVCERCGERQFFDAGEMAEMYDPKNPEQPSQLLHAICTPEGWDTA